MSSTEQSEFTDERDMAEEALRHAWADFPRTLLWTRAERLAEAQVHATLAVAAAEWAHAGMFPDAEPDAATAEEIENAAFDEAEEAAMDAEYRERLAECWTAAMNAARKSEMHFPADCLAAAIDRLRREGPADAFTGSERADEVGA